MGRGNDTKMASKFWGGERRRRNKIRRRNKSRDRIERRRTNQRKLRRRRKGQF